MYSTQIFDFKRDEQKQLAAEKSWFVASTHTQLCDAQFQYDILIREGNTVKLFENETEIQR